MTFWRRIYIPIKKVAFLKLPSYDLDRDGKLSLWGAIPTEFHFFNTIAAWNRSWGRVLTVSQLALYTHDIISGMNSPQTRWSESIIRDNAVSKDCYWFT